MPEVAPLAGAWIETAKSKRKYSRQEVAPLAGAWIETLIPIGGKKAPGRTPRGCVD